MENNQTLHLLRYWFDKLELIANNNFKKVEGQPINLEPSLSRRIQKVDENQAVVSISIKTKESKDDVPFFLDVCISGLFSCPLWEDSDDGKFYINETTSTILFPYLRQAVTTLTSLGNFPPFVLPIINTYSLFNKENKNMNK